MNTGNRETFTISPLSLRVLESKLESYGRKSEYLNGKIKEIQKCIQEILADNGGESGNFTVSAEKDYGFENFVTILSVFYGTTQIPSLNGYCLNFLIEFLSQIESKEYKEEGEEFKEEGEKERKKFKKVSLETIIAEVTQEQIEAIIGNGFDRDKNIGKLREKGLGDALEKYDIQESVTKTGLRF